MKEPQVDVIKETKIVGVRVILGEVPVDIHANNGSYLYSIKHDATGKVVTFVRGRFFGKNEDSLEQPMNHYPIWPKDGGY